MTTEQITILDGDDWFGVYRGDELVFEGHSIEPVELLSALGIPVEVKYDADPGISGTFPQRLADFNARSYLPRLSSADDFALVAEHHTCPINPTHHGQTVEHACGCSSFSCQDCDLTHGLSVPVCPLRRREPLGYTHPALTAMHASPVGPD